MIKLCQTFQSPYKPSQVSMLFHTTYLPLSEFCSRCDCGQISKNIFFFLNLLMQKIFFHKNHWFQLLSTKNNWIISLFLISITLHSHSTMSSFCLQKNSLWLSMKTLLLLLTKLPSARKLCSSDCSPSSFCFFPFSFFGLLGPILPIRRGWITQSPEKCTNQVILSDEHMNYLFRA